MRIHDGNLVAAAWIGAGFFAMPGVALASGNGFEWHVQGWYILDFLVVIVPLVWWLVPKARTFLQTRRSAAGRELNSATAGRDQAGERLAGVEARMAALSGEVTSLLQEFRALASEEAESIRKDGLRQIERMHEDARFRIEQAGKMARQDLTEALVRHALNKAEKGIAGGPDRQGMVVDAFLAGVARKEGTWRAPA